MSMSAALAKPGCGCGCGGSGGNSSGCAGCGSAAAGANPVASAFVRPRFFAGQLLTEDDLTALADYTIGKDRLHNRYLFGAGVVCGLWASCDPCGGGTVTVAPGYALDCCGRDLVLGCATTLDVNAMIRDLLAAQLGKDCGDPCSGPAAFSSAGQGAPVNRHYRLFARYGEQSTDPVAPYATGDQCGPVTCESTRIREGISFVLKCPAEAPPPDDFLTRLRACQPGEDVARREARLKEYSEAVRAASSGEENAEHRESLRVDLETIESDAAAVKEWLLDRLDSDPELSDCQLRSQVRAVSVTTKAEEEEAVKVRVLARAATELTSMFTRIVQDCVCRAVNPPCAPCADTDVPLACLEVADCTVVSICNAERDYVLSGPALRYWHPDVLPPEAAECSCGCGERRRDLSRPEAPADMLREMTEPPAARQEAPTAAESTDSGLAQQVQALEQRIAELTAQLTQSPAQTQASPGAPGGEMPAKQAQRRPRAPRNRSAAKDPAGPRSPADAQETDAQETAATEAQPPADAEHPAQADETGDQQ